MNLSPNVSLEDALRTSHGKNDLEQVLRYGRIHSVESIQRNLVRTAEVLEKFLPHFHGHISSMYRSPRVNALVGGARNSAHLAGLAVDYQPNAKHADVAKWAIEHAEDLAYDRLILEGRGKTKWLHIQIAEEHAAPQRLLFASPSGGLYIANTQTQFIKYAESLS